MGFNWERDKVILNLKGQKIHQVDQFKYHGCWIPDDFNSDPEIKIRIEIATTTLKVMKTLLCDDDLNLKVRQCMVKYYGVKILGIKRHNEKANL